MYVKYLRSFSYLGGGCPQTSPSWSTSHTPHHRPQIETVKLWDSSETVSSSLVKYQSEDEANTPSFS